MTASAYLKAVRHVMEEMPILQINELIAMLRSARSAGATVFIAGNGGSAETANHFATDLCKAANVKANSLAANIGTITAYANDCGYEWVFATQLVRHARMGDLLICISVSGDSPNVVRAAEQAHTMGVFTAALTGKEGGDLRGLVDLELNIPNAPYGLTEDLHLMCCHMVTEGLKD